MDQKSPLRLDRFWALQLAFSESGQFGSAGLPSVSGSMDMPELNQWKSFSVVANEFKNFGRASHA
jgi:hypothetical protein